MTKLDPLVAKLRWRGYSRELLPDGRQPLGYDYEQVSFTSPWKVMTGRYTREGDGCEPVHKLDDLFVITKERLRYLETTHARGRLLRA
jgi:hypothetical protein